MIVKSASSHIRQGGEAMTACEECKEGCHAHLKLCPPCFDSYVCDREVAEERAKRIEELKITVDAYRKTLENITKTSVDHKARLSSIKVLNRLDASKEGK